MEEMIPCSVKDQEVFQRVWQRVMGDRGQESSPIRPGPLNMEGDLSCDCLKALAQQQGTGFPPECERQEPLAPEPPAQGQPAQPMEPEMPMEPEPSVQKPNCWRPVEEPPIQEPPTQESQTQDQPVPEETCEECAEAEGLPEADGPDRGNDLPQLWEEPQSADDRTARLRRHVMDALEGWQFYRHLARRARGTDARTLNSMAGEQHKEARKLSAAYFLLTGLRYWPSELLGVPAIPSYWGALRTRHQAEQRQENAYRLAADDWDDPDLLALYNELIEGCQRRSHQLRSLLE
ncbi:MAG: hypothetical protein K2M15_05075, partial [Oscillospiraceae bacterium]|nr:hypothetical protein [Oscillospiraceae bacterium]